MLISAQPGSRPRGVLPPCRRCGTVDPDRMYALMALWFSGLTGVHVDSGYFYLCPRCYDTYVAPHIAELFQRGPRHFMRPDPSSSEDLHL
ncbi:MAG TPA: hypothetical protein VFZ69_09555 [Longimicrobiales bacterium]